MIKLLNKLTFKYKFNKTGISCTEARLGFYPRGFLIFILSKIICTSLKTTVDILQLTSDYQIYEHV